MEQKKKPNYKLYFGIAIGIGIFILLLSGWQINKAKVNLFFVEFEIGQPSQNAESETTSLPRNWYVPFKAVFAPYTWTEGGHSYQFSAACPDSANSTGVNESLYAFYVSSSTPMLNTDLYIRRGGIYSDFIEKIDSINTINPAETTTASYTVFLTSYQDAQQAKDECIVTIKVDSGSPIQLIPDEIQESGE